MVGDGSESDLQRKKFSRGSRDDMKRRRRCIAGCNGRGNVPATVSRCSCNSQPMFLQQSADVPATVSRCSLRNQPVLEINGIAGETHKPSLDVDRRAGTHSVGAWSFMFAVFPGV